MAQTKTRRSGSSSRSSGSSRSGSAKSRSNSGGSTKGRSSSGTRKAGSATKTAKRATSKANSVGGTLSNVVSKAKTPLVAGGAALAGLAGGVALARNGARGKWLGLPRGMSLPKPKLGSTEPVSKALGNAAKEFGKAGVKAGELATEVRKTREQMNDGK